ncbi:NYN domain-containing protein [Kocuria sp. CH-021]|uniref:NYN domain-containing protein n=1 Tax=Kocuria sp. CH-021 TaxID=3406735 RepID=UPI003C7970A5
MKRQYSPLRATEDRRLHGRALFVIDIENMVGSCRLDVADVARTRTRIHAAVNLGAGDHTVIAASHYNAEAAYFGWAGPAQRLARSGKDGADLALLEVIDDAAWVAHRYERVVLASGDHAFAYAVAALKAAGVQVLVIPPDTGFSPQMRLVAGPDVARLGSPLPANVISLFRATKDVA